MTRMYRDVITWISSYTMEELAGLIFWGGFVAHAGPSGFQKLFELLQPALWHYMYNFKATPEEMRSAAHSLREYAKTLEEYVLKQQVLLHLSRTHTCSSAMYVMCAALTSRSFNSQRMVCLH
jgi:hypothetical protein